MLTIPKFPEIIEYVLGLHMEISNFFKVVEVGKHCYINILTLLLHNDK